MKYLKGFQKKCCWYLSTSLWWCGKTNNPPSPWSVPRIFAVWSLHLIYLSQHCCNSQAINWYWYCAPSIIRLWLAFKLYHLDFSALFDPLQMMQSNFGPRYASHWPQRSKRHQWVIKTRLSAEISHSCSFLPVSNKIFPLNCFLPGKIFDLDQFKPFLCLNKAAVPILDARFSTISDHFFFELRSPFYAYFW